MADVLASVEAFSPDRVLIAAGVVVLVALVGGLLVMWAGGRG
ncbi:hypothetical protein [Thermomonospora catenispora]|nr:hypothetical protein [Thermomonospora catenispora]